MSYILNNRQSIWKYVSFSLIGFVIGVGIGSLLYITNSYKIKQSLESIKPTYNSLEENEKIAVITELEKKFNDIKNKNTAFNVQVGNNMSDYYLYNKNQECVMYASDSSYVVIFNKDGESIKSIVKDNTVILNSCIDFLTPCIKAIELLKTNKEDVSISNITYNNSDNNGIKEYVIDIKGYNNIKGLYETIGEEFATTMVDSLQKYIGEEYVPHLQYGYIYSDSGELALYCNAVIDGQVYLNWICEGYTEFVDWGLSEDWYTIEFKKENSQKLYDLMQKDLSKLNNIIEKDSKE